MNANKSICCNHNCNQGRDCPLRNKELTDEEILKMAADKFHYSEYKLVIDFARAILRKASEK